MQRELDANLRREKALFWVFCDLRGKEKKLRLDSVKQRCVKIPVVGVQLDPWELGGRESPLMFGLSPRRHCHNACRLASS